MSAPNPYRAEMTLDYGNVKTMLRLSVGDLVALEIQIKEFEGDVLGYLEKIDKKRLSLSSCLAVIEHAMTRGGLSSDDAKSRTYDLPGNIAIKTSMQLLLFAFNGGMSPNADSVAGNA